MVFIKKKLINEEISNGASPLACRMRPETLEAFVGQKHILDRGRQLRRIIDSGNLFSAIFYGPPGCGKSAVANIISFGMNQRVENINAAYSNVKDIREIVLRAKHPPLKKTLLIVDEIHRFSRTQQESLLRPVEEGTVSLIGITSENPFYFVSGPLLSRTIVYKFNPLKKEEIKKILQNALKSVRGLKKFHIEISDDALNMIAASGRGDARYSLNILELAALTTEPINGKIPLSAETIRLCIGEKKLYYDRSGNEHYDTISAFIKSMRGSDPDAAVFYLAKMISSGEDPRFIARRIAICASEDIGNADPQALILANAALNAVEYIGMPESRMVLAQAAIYVACAPKSNACYLAINEALKFIKENDGLIVPHHLTKAGSKNYKYPHDFKYGYVKQNYFPGRDTLGFYQPVNRGHEKYIKKYLDFFKKDKKKQNPSNAEK